MVVANSGTTEQSRKEKGKEKQEAFASASFVVMAARIIAAAGASTCLSANPTPCSPRTSILLAIGTRTATTLRKRSGVSIFRRGLAERGFNLSFQSSGALVGGRVVRASGALVDMAGNLGKLKKEEVLQVYEDVEELSVSLAAHVARVAEDAIAAHGAFSVVLSGGSLIKTLGLVDLGFWMLASV